MIREPDPAQAADESTSMVKMSFMTLMTKGDVSKFARIL
jgi:hypothetical protein